MKKILHIIASPRDESRTLQISQSFLDVFVKRCPDYVVDELNLSTQDLPELSAKSVSGKYLLLDGKGIFGSLKESWLQIIQYIEGFLTSDVYVISCPMWNFSIPYRLKHYIDLIVQPKYLFRYNESGQAEGLVKNKKMIIVMTRGGQYQQGDAFDFQEPYLRTIFGYVGITDITFIKAEGMDSGTDAEKASRLTEAISQAKKLGQTL